MRKPPLPAHGYGLLTREFYSPEMRARMDAREKRRRKAAERRSRLAGMVLAELAKDALVGMNVQAGADAARRKRYKDKPQPDYHALYDQALAANPDLGPHPWSLCGIIARRLGLTTQQVYNRTKDRHRPKPRKK